MPLVLCMEEGFVDVGPEFLEDEGARVAADVDSPLFGGVGKGALGGRIVEIRDASGSAGTDDFTRIEGFVSGIVSGDDGAGESVLGALEKAALAQGVVAVILMRDDRDDGFDHVILDRLIDKAVPVVAGIAGSALVELRSLVGGLGIACEEGGDKEGGVVEGVLGGGEELFLGRLRRKLSWGADGAKV